MRVKDYREKPKFKYKNSCLGCMKEEKVVEETITCMICTEEKPYYYRKKLFKKTYDVCEDCSRQAKTEGVANTLVNAWFSDTDIEEGSVVAQNKLKGMSNKKKSKLTKRLKRLGYSDDMIQEAIFRIESGGSL